MRDQMDRLHFQAAFAPKAAVTDNTAQVSSTCDCLGYEAVTLAMITGTLTDADATFTGLLEESDDNSTFTTVAAADMVGTVALANFQFDDDIEPRKIGYVGRKRYVRYTVTPANNTGNLFLGGVWVLGYPNRQPTPNPPI